MGTSAAKLTRPGPMRVALVVERFAASGGGVEHVVSAVARELAAAGDEVHVIARAGVEVAEVTLHRVAVPSFWQPLRVAAFSAAATREVERGSYDVVHSFCRSRSQDVFHAGGGSHWHYMQNTYGARGAALRRASPRHAVQLAMERRIFDDPRQLIQCVSSRVKDQIAERFAVADERLVVVHNGVDVERFESARSSDARAEVRREQRAGTGSVWIFCGSGWRRKGLDTALRALSSCDDKQAVLWVAGADTLPAWQRLADSLGLRDRVRFLGVRDDMDRVYAAADALLLPSRYDGFALVALEAAATGLPVVISAAAGASELFREAGIVVADAEDTTAFANAMTELGDPDLRAARCAAGQKVAADHTWRAQVEKLRGLYARVIAR